MHYWSLYFFAKFGLFLAEVIRFGWLSNLLLAIFVSLRFRDRRWRIAQQCIAIPVAIALLYSESNLPPIERALAAAKDLAGFSPGYLMELIGRFVGWRDLAIVAAMLLVYRLLASRIRFTSFAFLVIFMVPVVTHFRQPADDRQAIMTARAGQAPLNAQDPAALLDAFYTEERARVPISFPATQSGRLPFDVVLLHVCSLSWDDLDFVGEGNPEILKRFDVIFRHFNSAASYSGPAALRVLRGNCGQTAHASLYSAVTDECSLFKNFTAAGYDAHALLNHDGVFGHFASDLETYSGLGQHPEIATEGEVAMRSFDGRPIYGDLSVLSRWWNAHRLNTPTGSTKPVALYYNTISLHDGNVVEGMKGRGSLQTYKPRLDKMLQDFDRFITQLEDAGRPVVVIMVPEHGAALRGDKVQIAGLREIPNPRVTLVPAAVKVIGMKNEGQPSPPVFVDHPTSYTALFSLLSSILGQEASTLDRLQLADMAKTLPATRFVSENEKIIVMQGENDYFMRSAEGTWIRYND